MQESSPFVCFLKSADMNLYLQTLDLISGEITIIFNHFGPKQRKKNKREKEKWNRNGKTHCGIEEPEL